MEVSKTIGKRSKITKTFKMDICNVVLPFIGVYINLYFLWLIFLFIGGLLLLFKNKLIQGNMKTKITIIEAFTTLGLIFLVFSNLMPNIKQLQLILLIVVTIIIYSHTKLLLAGKLT